MKKDYFFLEFIKSGPFLLLVILALIIVLGIMISNRDKDKVQMKEDILYVVPKPNN